MIIRCHNCNKNFDVQANLIPESGRLVKCGSCNHEWFFKVEVINDNRELKTDEAITPIKNKKPLINEYAKKNKKNPSEKNQLRSATHKNNKNNFLSLTIVMIVSFVAFIILIDTFKGPIGSIVPNVETILYNLYETIKDIMLFLKDLV